MYLIIRKFGNNFDIIDAQEVYTEAIETLNRLKNKSAFDKDHCISTSAINKMEWYLVNCETVSITKGIDL